MMSCDKEAAMPEVAVNDQAASGVGVLKLPPTGCRSSGSHVCNSMNRLN
jgi:hypothetical protein